MTSDLFGPRHEMAEAPTRLRPAMPMTGSTTTLSQLAIAASDELTDCDLLALALSPHYPEGGARTVAAAVLSVFGTIAHATVASPLALARIPGLSSAGAITIRLLHVAATRILKSQLINRPLLSNWSALTDYLRVKFGAEPIEAFHVLYLDSSNRLIRDETISRGTVDHAPVYPREVLRRALELHAAGLVIAHNHPSGDPTPSRQDIAMTTEIKQGADVFGIALHDHIIVALERTLSFRAEKLL